MFCFKCGTQLPDEARFCFKCGQDLSILFGETKAESTKEEIEVVKKDDKEIDRDVLKMYLNDLLVLEFLRIKKLESVKQLEENFNHSKKLFSYNQSVKPDITKPIKRNLTWSYSFKDPISIWKNRESKYINFFENNGDIYVAVQGRGSRKWLDTNLILPNGSSPYSLTPVHSVINELDSSAFFSIAGLKTKTRVEEAHRQFNSALNEFRKMVDADTKDFKARHGDSKTVTYRAYSSNGTIERLWPQDFERETQQLEDNWKESKNEVKNFLTDYEQICQSLSDLYNLNIIPLSYRDPYTIKYILDTISTSNLSFDSALYHLDLNRIREMVTLNVDQSLTQANALKRLQDQNQQLLNQLAQINKNTALSAFYDEYAATHEKTWTMIGFSIPI